MVSAMRMSTANRETLTFSPLFLIPAILIFACESGGVGDPCTPEEEYDENFSGFDVGEVSVQSRSYECQTRVCLVNKFQGRVSCPYGANGPNVDGMAPPTVDHGFQCQIPSAVEGTYTSIAVEPQLLDRPPEVGVYCSCRCSGPDPNARYCECPNGFECADIGLTNSTLAGLAITGNYCVKNGTNGDPVTFSADTCELPDEGRQPGLGELTCGAAPAN